MKSWSMLRREGIITWLWLRTEKRTYGGEAMWGSSGFQTRIYCRKMKWGSVWIFLRSCRCEISSPLRLERRIRWFWCEMEHWKRSDGVSSGRSGHRSSTRKFLRFTLWKRNSARFHVGLPSVWGWLKKDMCILGGLGWMGSLEIKAYWKVSFQLEWARTPKLRRRN